MKVFSKVNLYRLLTQGIFGYRYYIFQTISCVILIDDIVRNLNLLEFFVLGLWWDTW